MNATHLNQTRRFLPTKWRLGMACMALCAASFTFLPAAAQSSDSAEALFKTLYGERYDEALDSRSTDDDSALADEMIKALGYEDLNADLKSHIARKILELKLSDNQGRKAAELASNWLAENDPKLAGWALEQQSETIRLRMMQTPLRERAPLGMQYFNALMKAGAAYESAADPESASTVYRKALGLSRYIEREQVEAARDASKRASSLSRFARELDQLKADFVDDPKVETAEKIAHIYLIVFNAPAQAAPYASIIENDAFKTVAKSHGKAVDDLKPDDLLDTALAYESLLDEADEEYQKANLASRSLAYYDAFLGKYADQDLKRIKAVAGMNKMKEIVEEYGASTTQLTSKGLKVSEYLLKNWGKVKGTVWEDAKVWSMAQGKIVNSTGNVDAQWSEPINLPIKINGDYEFTAQVRMTKFNPKNKRTPGGVVFHVQVGDRTIPIIYRENSQLKDINAQKQKNGKRNNRTFTLNIAVPKPAENQFNTVNVKVKSRDDKAMIVVSINGKVAMEYNGPLSDLKHSSVKPNIGRLSKNGISGLRHGAFEMRSLTYSGSVNFADPQYK